MYVYYTEAVMDRLNAVNTVKVRCMCVVCSFLTFFDQNDRSDFLQRGKVFGPSLLEVLLYISRKVIRSVQPAQPLLNEQTGNIRLKYDYE